MAVTTTGSLVKGLVDGLTPGLRGPGGPSITYVNGDPDGVLTGIEVSGLALDPANEKIYMNKIVGGSTWFNLGSRT